MDKDTARTIQALNTVRSEIQGWGDTFRLQMETLQMTLDDLRLKIQNESSVIDSVLTLVRDLKDRVSALGAETPIDANKVAELADLLDTNAAKLAAAVVVSTVAEPENTPTPAPVEPAASSPPAVDAAPASTDSVSLPTMPVADPVLDPAIDPAT